MADVELAICHSNSSFKSWGHQNPKQHGKTRGNAIYETIPILVQFPLDRWRGRGGRWGRNLTWETRVFKLVMSMMVRFSSSTLMEYSWMVTSSLDTSFWNTLWLEKRVDESASQNKRERKMDGVQFFPTENVDGGDVLLYLCWRFRSEP